MKNNPLLLVTLVAFLFSSAIASWAGLPQGTQTLVRFRRAYLISNITYPAGVGYYPQQEDDDGAITETKKTPVKTIPSLKPKTNRLPVAAEEKTSIKASLNQPAFEAEIQAVEAYKKRNSFTKRFNNGLFNILNVVEFGDASIAKRMQLTPPSMGVLHHYDNGEDYLYLPAIGIPLPIRLQSKNTFIH